MEREFERIGGRGRRRRRMKPEPHENVIEMMLKTTDGENFDPKRKYKKSRKN